MDKILNKIFELYDFKKLKSNLDNEKKEFDIYCNENSETYIVLHNEKLAPQLIDKILRICREDIYISDTLTKSQRANLYIIVTCEVEDISSSKKNIIFQIEENSLYYKKFVLWYTREELVALQSLLGGDFKLCELEKYIVDKELFKEFKSTGEISYDILSRIYIKLAFLTLMNLEPLNQSLSGFMEENLKSLQRDIFDCIKGRKDNIDFPELYNLIELDSAEIELIEREIEGVLNEK